MKLVVNYLKEVQELYEERKIDFVDCFKLYSLNNDLSPLKWCLEHKDVIFHGIVGGESSFGDKDLLKITNIEATNEVLQKTNAPYISGTNGRKYQTVGNAKPVNSVQKTGRYVSESEVEINAR